MNMTPETQREYAELGMYPIQRLLPDLESGEKEIIPGKKVSIQTYGRMSHIPSAKLTPPVKHIVVTIMEACNQLQTEIRAQITTHGSPKVLSIAIRINGTTLVLHDEQKDMINWHMVREIERDLKAYIKLRDDEAPAVQRIKAATRNAAIHAEAVENDFDGREGKRRSRKGRANKQ